MIRTDGVTIFVFLAAAGIPVQESSVFTMRALATDDNGFDMRDEVSRLQEWLATPGIKQKIESEPLRIHLYNWLRTEPDLAWYPRVIRPAHTGSRWDYSLAMGYLATKAGDDHAVALFNRKEYEQGPQSPGAPDFLLELVPIDMRQLHFNQSDVELDSLRVVADAAGNPAINYTIKPEREDAYADWTGSMIDKKSAISVNGIVLTAPVFRGRIRSRGQISGGWGQGEAEELVRSLRASKGTGDEQLLAANELIREHPDDPSVIPAHAYRLLHDPDEQIRLESTTALGKLADRSAPAIPHLILGLQDESLRVRAEVITTLGLIGPGAKAAIPSLQPLTGDDDEQIVERARAALRQIMR